MRKEKQRKSHDECTLLAGAFSKEPKNSGRLFCVVIKLHQASKAWKLITLCQHLSLLPSLFSPFQPNLFFFFFFSYLRASRFTLTV